MEDSHGVGYLSKTSRISSIDRKSENFLESSPAAPLLQRGSEFALLNEPKISPQFLFWDIGRVDI